MLDARSDLMRAEWMLGVGPGGFADGIVLHQILQWHNMLSVNVAPSSYASTQCHWHRRAHFRFPSVELADL